MAPNLSVLRQAPSALCTFMSIALIQAVRCPAASARLAQLAQLAKALLCHCAAPQLLHMHVPPGSHAHNPSPRPRRGLKQGRKGRGLRGTPAPCRRACRPQKTRGYNWICRALIRCVLVMRGSGVRSCFPGVLSIVSARVTSAKCRVQSVASRCRVSHRGVERRSGDRSAAPASGVR